MFRLLALFLGITAFLSGVARADAPVSAVALPLQITECGERVYDLALNNRWKEAAQGAAQIERLGQALPADGKGLRPRFALFEAIARLRQSVERHDLWDAAWAANRVTLSGARLAHGVPRAIPFEVTMLDVYARELQVAGGRRDEMAAYKSLGNLRLNWQKVRPLLRQSSASERALAARFDSSLHQVCEGTDSIAMARQAPSLLVEVDDLEQLFALRGKAPNAPEQA